VTPLVIDNPDDHPDTDRSPTKQTGTAQPGTERPDRAGPLVAVGGGRGSAGARDPQSFDHLAGRYDRFTELIGGQLRGWLDSVLPEEPPDPVTDGGWTALDAGCGTGALTGMLADRYTGVLAVDLSAPMVDHARRHRAGDNVRYEVRDLREVTGLGDGQFDVVLCAYTLHHIPELSLGLRHLRSLVAPSGTLVLVDVVDERGMVPRGWFRAEAWRGFRADLRHRRRPVREAVELLRLNLDSDWLDHQTTDRLVAPAVWEDTARQVFPGAAIITGLYRSRALVWRAPRPLTGPLWTTTHGRARTRDRDR
jgi:2-polyprenyl-3-methyl-5-hydroxy-6-metoxy-1,4-benzoquinol methylase